MRSSDTNGGDLMPRKGTKLSPEARAKNAEASKRWRAENRVQLSVLLTPEARERYHRLADARGTTVGTMIKTYLDGECEKERL